jgi:hypothetical protein
MANKAQLFNELRELQSNKRHGATCSLGALMRGLEPDVLGALNTAFSDYSLDAVTIATWLSAKGHKINSWTVNRHRRNLCSCEK